ncbi:hypothetical protein EZV62_011223 [Acer yangbiense]|uniref:Uncharacterized protein n=1 Tax=Acer yangbiense TaxID=1000413 RepID=A0A5C7I5V0_9ROSI|nr:hypothetical protein EZV62_011223 [Acer yangbiense]
MPSSSFLPQETLPSPYQYHHNVRPHSGLDEDDLGLCGESDEVDEVDGVRAVAGIDDFEKNVNLELFKGYNSHPGNEFNNPDIKCGVISDLLRDQYNVTVDAHRLYKILPQPSKGSSSALKHGRRVMEGCEPVIGVDGCHLKDYIEEYFSELLP